MQFCFAISQLIIWHLCACAAKRKSELVRHLRAVQVAYDLRCTPSVLAQIDDAWDEEPKRGSIADGDCGLVTTMMCTGGFQSSVLRTAHAMAAKLFDAMAVQRSQGARVSTRH